MKKYFIFTIIVFNLFILNIKGVTYDTLSIGPVSWDYLYYTKINNQTGELSYSYMKMFIRNSDGRPVYCIEPGVNISYEETYVGYNSNQARYANLSKSVYERVSLIAYFGYGYQDNNYNHTDSIWWAITQWMIWQEANNNHTLYFTQNQNYNGDEIPIDRFSNEIAEINTLINRYNTSPAINIPTMVLGQTIELNDSNGLLHNYIINECRGCEARIENDKLILKATNVSNAQILLERKFDNYNSDPIVYISGNHQNVMAAGRIKNKKMGINFFITSGQVKIQKLDKDTQTNQAQGEAQLSNAIYGVYNSLNEKAFEITTDDNGQGVYADLPIGSYYIQEIKSSTGYTLDNKKYYFNIDNNHLNVSINVYEKVIEKTFEIVKVKANSNTSILDAEDNITFEFYLNGQLYKTVSTDNNGKISIVLPYGSYTVHQVNSDENVEQIEDFVINIDNSEESIITKVIANASLSARVKLIKIDKDTKEKIKISGIKFKIKNLDTNEYVCQSVFYPEEKQICVFETDNNGTFITPYPLEYGNYQIEELDQRIDGYLVNKEPLVFSITKDLVIFDKELGLITELYFENEKLKEEKKSELIEEPINNLIIEVPNTRNNNLYLLEFISFLILLIYGVQYVKEKKI